MEQASFLQILFDIILWGLIGVSMYRAYRFPFHTNEVGRAVAYIAILTFCLYTFWAGDYFHYREAFYGYKVGYYSHSEGIYLWMYENLSSYIIFRLLVWGGALLILFKAYNISSPKIDLCILIFGMCYLHLFSYARASLAMAIIIFSLAVLSEKFFSNNHYHYIWLILAFIVLGCSMFFHRSAIIGIVAAIASLFMFKMEKRMLVVLAFLFPLMIYFMQYMINSFVDMDLDYETYITARHRDIYLTDSSRSLLGGGLGKAIEIIAVRGSLYLSALLFILMVRSGKYKEFTVGERILSSYAFCVILFGIGFLFDFGYDTSILHYRTLNFAMPANAVFLAAVHRQGSYKGLFSLIYYLSMFGALYTMVYALYCAW